MQKLKKFLPQIQSYEDAPFLGPKWPTCLNKDFFRKPINKTYSFHPCLCTCQKSTPDINLLMKYWRLPLWILGGGLNFCMQWHLCKFLILGDVYNHLFGLVFPCPTSKKMRVGVIGLPPTPLSSIKVGFFKTMSLKKYFKTLLWHFLYMFLFRNPQAPFRQLGPSFLAWNLNKYDKLFYADGSSKTTCWCSLKRKFN